jgi:hypothetical protein
MRGLRGHIDRMLGSWFEFGVHPDGRVDIAGGTETFDARFEKLTKGQADQLIALREKFLEDVALVLEQEERNAGHRPATDNERPNRER